MKFRDYLVDKKIDPAAFAKSEPARFSEFSKAFAQMHPNSFTMQKLFLINSIRRLYPLPADQWVKADKRTEKASAPVLAKPASKIAQDVKKPSRPVIKPKPIIKKK
ncbi:hypothetical protein [Fulvivirga sedimenti]|uniref:Uncharacterized protein n=1 Tax=Fulvivirga sedimenti TaxID=2879465 RepID=A0A9X1L1B7_9BACT|nr:hypothetical protein [Fulvivirga sedimenti]MCA6078062.1 hypothetical protein [Fulvivirga sedimenti]